MVRKSSKQRKERKGRKQRRTLRKQRAGGYSFGPAITHGLVNNYGQAAVPYAKYTPDCVAAAKTDTLGYSGPKGLPGLSGGGSRKQSGGRYGFVSAEGAAIAGPPSMGGLAPMTRIACESSTPNPLNPGPHTPSTVPSGAAADPKPMAGGGVPESITVPTAGYTNRASNWVSSTGSPSLIQLPYDAKQMNPACLKTGGGSRKRKMTRRKQRNQRNQRKH